MPGDEYTIRLLSDSDSLDDLTELLHRAYRRLADMNLRYLATHQDVNTTRSRVSKGTCLVAVKGDQLIGTVTVYPPTTTSGSPWMKRKDVSVFGQLAVEPTLQGKGLGRILISAAAELAKELGAAYLSLDTAESAGHLIEWYERLGFHFVEYVDWDETNYRSVVMTKSLKDSTK